MSLIFSLSAIIQSPLIYSSHLKSRFFVFVAGIRIVENYHFDIIAYLAKKSCDFGQFLQFVFPEKREIAFMVSSVLGNWISCK